MKYYSYLEVINHTNEESCWILVGRNIYDVTEFLNIHPGSKEAILKYAGQNAKESYNYHSVWKEIMEEIILLANYLKMI